MWNDRRTDGDWKEFGRKQLWLSFQGLRRITKLHSR
jgi:hypothetical protein